MRFTESGDARRVSVLRTMVSVSVGAGSTQVAWLSCHPSCCRRRTPLARIASLWSAATPGFEDGTPRHTCTSSAQRSFTTWGILRSASLHCRPGPGGRVATHRVGGSHLCDLAAALASRGPHRHQHQVADRRPRSGVCALRNRVGMKGSRRLAVKLDHLRVRTDAGDRPSPYVVVHIPVDAWSGDGWLVECRVR